MKRSVSVLLMAVIAMAAFAGKKKAVSSEQWPDGTVMDTWFSDTAKVDVNTLGRQYVVTDYGVAADSTIVQTEALQTVIDKVASDGGGVVVIPRGTFLTGALFFKSGTHLHLLEGATLRGSDRIIDYPIMETRIEGETCRYFCALINADGLDGFTITGTGTIDGNGLKYWQEFWIRRQWNPQCTNKDAQRPRLVYISNSRNVTVQDVHLVNSPFWTNHLYHCDHVRYLDCYIFAPTEGVLVEGRGSRVEGQAAKSKGYGAPSSDAIDLDVCHDVLIHGCYMHVNDDAVVMKGGKGTFADKDPNNGSNANVLIEDCTYGRVHGCLTLGSESLYNRNIVLRRCHARDANRVLWLKMRPDTPQHYEYVTVDGMDGKCGSFLVVRPWTQFFKPQQRDDMPLSQCNNIVIRNINMDCKTFFDVGKSDKYALKDFTFENVLVDSKESRVESRGSREEGPTPDPSRTGGEIIQSIIDGTTIKNVTIE